MEYDLVVAPGADPSRIELSFPGARQLHLNRESGDLKLEEAGGEVSLPKPVAYQVAEGKRVAVEACYALEFGNRVGLALGRYDATQPLIVDPVLVYSTYLGGSGSDVGQGIAVDSWGNAYVTGRTLSSDFPLAHPLPTNSAFRGNNDAFVSKLSFDARTQALSLVYSTYLGGSGNDGGQGIAVDTLGNAYVTGFTESSDFPLAHPLPSNNVTGPGIDSCFVSKLSFDARTQTLSLAYSTYLGNAVGQGIAVDALGNAYLTGSAGSPFPLAHPLPSNTVYRGPQNAFVSKLSFDARSKALSLTYSTYLGGGGGVSGDAGFGIAVDALGNAYVTGYTSSFDFPLAHPLPTNSVLGGTQNAFVSKLSFDARTQALSLAYSTYLGSSGADVGSGIAVDVLGNAYVTGETAFSSGFPLAHPLPTNSVLRGIANAFVSKLRFDARTQTLSLAYSTYLGGSVADGGDGIAVDTWGNAYVTGFTGSPDFPLAHPLPSNSVFGGIQNAFVSKLSFDARTQTLSLAYSTYLGGRNQNLGPGFIFDEGLGIAVDALGNAYVTGDTNSSDFPLAHPLPPNSVFRGGDSDAFVAKIRTLGFEDRDAEKDR